MMLKIGLVTGEFPPMEGGVGAFTEHLARGLVALGHEVHVITDRRARPGGGRGGGGGRGDGGGRRRLSEVFEPLELGYGGPGVAWLHARVGRWNWGALGVVADVAVRYGLDVVNVEYQAAAFGLRSWGIFGLPWRLRGVSRVVVTFHDLRVPFLFPKAGGLREGVLRLMARMADGVVVTNGEDLGRVRGWQVAGGRGRVAGGKWQVAGGGGLVGDRVREIPIGSNIGVYVPNGFEVEEARRLLGVGADDFLLGYFGFLSESKGGDVLVEALGRLDGRFHVVFVGGVTGDSDGGSNEVFVAGLRERIGALGLEGRVHWTGFLEGERVSVFLEAADLMVLPYRDGVSLRRGSLMAVLAHGRPLVTTRPVVAVGELVHGVNVWMVEGGDGLVEALVEGIGVLAADGEGRMRLGVGAREVAGLFSWERIAGETAGFYGELVEGEWVTGG